MAARPWGIRGIGPALALLGLLALPTAAGAAAGAAAERAAIDCQRAGSAEERLICATPALAAAERQLAQLYHDLGNAISAVSADAGRRLQQEQRQWQAGRGPGCGFGPGIEVTPEARSTFIDCLADSYRERRRDLEAARKGLPLSAALAAVELRRAEPKLRYQIEAHYPQIVGSQIAGAEAFNQRVKAWVEGQIEEARRSFAAAAAEPGVRPPADDQPGSALVLHYDLFYPSQSLISLRFTSESYFAGAAHGTTQHVSLLLALERGRALAASDLFRPESGWQEALARQCLQQLTQAAAGEPGNEFLPDDAANAVREVVSDLANWSFDGDGALIAFDPYTLFAYAAGTKEVTLPYELLRPYLRPDAPVGGKR